MTQTYKPTSDGSVAARTAGGGLHRATKFGTTEKSMSRHGMIVVAQSGVACGTSATLIESTSHKRGMRTAASLQGTKGSDSLSESKKRVWH